jgi:oxygen-independent coproporphyrinogen-3 oxidase
MYEFAREALAAAGYLHYEVSNWASAPGFQCRHNLTYWRNEPYIGIGAGANSWLGGRRLANAPYPAEYVARLHDGSSPIAAEEQIDRELEMGETMMMGLRLVDEGIQSARFRERFGVELCQQYPRELEELAALGLVELDDERLRLTQRGHLLGNQVFLRFLPG